MDIGNAKRVINYLTKNTDVRNKFIQ